MNIGTFFGKLAGATSIAAGTWQASLGALTLVLAWVFGGFFVGFSDSLYQLFINTVTTIITFLMVFLIQAAQNRDTLAIHTKLDEIIRSIPAARNELRQIETLSIDDVKTLQAQGANNV